MTSTPLLNARAQFIDIESRTPQLAEEEGVHQFIERIDEQFVGQAGCRCTVL